MAISFAEKMNNSKLMIAGIKQNQERLARRGLNTDFTSKYESVYSQVQMLDNEQESLKAELKTKTDVLAQKITELDALYSEAKKTVKIEMETTSWKEFGVQDKK